MILIIVANLIALVASLVMVYTGYLKDKKQILFYQIFQFILFIISYLILGGYTGVIICSLGIVRNLLCYYKKLKIPYIVLLSALCIILTIKFNTFGLIGILPLFGVVLYTCFMNTENIIKFKLLIINAMILSGIYDIVVMSYTSAFFDILTAIMNIFAIFQLCKHKR